LEYLLSKGASLDEKDENERTILMYAASGGHSKMIKHLITKGTTDHRRVMKRRTSRSRSSVSLTAEWA
jgi:ankyrin repeat protein